MAGFASQGAAVTLPQCLEFWSFFDVQIWHFDLHGNADHVLPNPDIL